MEIQVGEYVRNKCGAIRKFKGYLNEEMYISSLNYEDAIVNYKTDKLLLDSSFGGASIGRFKDIIKHSFNIIDLIEIEDLVSVIDGDTTAVCEVIGTEIRDKNFRKTNEIGVRYMSDEMDIIPLKRIKSIVTKEQFKAMEYEVK